MNAREIMTKTPETIRPDTSVREAASRLTCGLGEGGLSRPKGAKFISGARSARAASAGRVPAAPAAVRSSWMPRRPRTETADPPRLIAVAAASIQIAARPARFTMPPSIRSTPIIAPAFVARTP